MLQIFFFFATGYKRLGDVCIVVEKFFVSNDTGFFFDFGMRLPSPSSGRCAFFLSNGSTWFYAKSEQSQHGLPPGWFCDFSDFDDFRRFFWFEIEPSHRDSVSEVPSAPAARNLIFRRPHRMSAGFADMSILPCSETVTRLFHVEKYNIKENKTEYSPSSRCASCPICPRLWYKSSQTPERCRLCSFCVSY